MSKSRRFPARHLVSWGGRLTAAGGGDGRAHNLFEAEARAGLTTCAVRGQTAGAGGERGARGTSRAPRRARGPNAGAHNQAEYGGSLPGRLRRAEARQERAGRREQVARPATVLDSHQGMSTVSQLYPPCMSTCVKVRREQVARPASVWCLVFEVGVWIWRKTGYGSGQVMAQPLKSRAGPVGEGCVPQPDLFCEKNRSRKRSGEEACGAGSYLRMRLLYHSTLGLRVKKKRKRSRPVQSRGGHVRPGGVEHVVRQRGDGPAERLFAACCLGLGFGYEKKQVMGIWICR